MIPIRRALPDDADQLLPLLRALAEGEGEISALSREQLAEWLENGLLGWLAMPEGGEAAGCVLAYPGFDLASGRRGMHLADLFVRPAARRQGMATRLVQAVAHAAHIEGGSWVSWTLSADNQPARRFYRTLGARYREEVGFMTLSGPMLEGLAL